MKTFYELPTGVYLLISANAKKLSDAPYANMGASVWLYENSGNNERIGLLLNSATTNVGSQVCIGYQYGGENKLIWKKISLTS